MHNHGVESEYSCNHTNGDTQYQIVSQPSYSSKLNSISPQITHDHRFYHGKPVNMAKSQEQFSMSTPKPLNFDYADDDQIDALTDNGLFRYNRSRENSKNYEIDSYKPSDRIVYGKDKFSKTTSGGNLQSGFMSFKNFQADEINSESSHYQRQSHKSDFEKENKFDVKPEAYNKDVEYLGLYEEDLPSDNSQYYVKQSQHTQKSLKSENSHHQSSTLFHNSKKPQNQRSPFKNDQLSNLEH